MRSSIQSTSASMLVLLVGSMSYATRSAAQARQDILAANVDSTVSPRTDFFQFANGSWFRRNPIPADQGIWGTPYLVEEEIRSRQRRISERAAMSNAPRGSLEQLVGDFWYAGMDSTAINRLGLAPLKPDLDRIDRIGSVNDAIEFVAAMHRRGNRRVLFPTYVAADQRNSNQPIYILSQGGFSMQSPQHYTATDPLTLRVRDAFRDYLFKSFVRLHGDSARARSSATAVFNVEASLARANYGGDGYLKGSLAELRQHAPAIDWARYFRGVGLVDTQVVNISKPRFLSAVDSLLRAIPLEDWKDYLRFWDYNVNAPFLDDRAFADQFAYMSSNTGQAQPLPRWRRVLQRQSGVLNEPMAQLVLREYFPEQVTARYQRLAESIRDAFRERIANLEWMSDTTRKHALLKLDRLKITIGYPDSWRDFSGMDIRRDSYQQNMTRASTWSNDRIISSLTAPPDMTTYNSPIGTMGGAAYSDSRNAVSLEPGSFMVPGMRDEDLDDAFVYGYSFLGHEIAHGFDSDGRQYDANGNRVNWWSASDLASFSTRAQMMIDQFNAFEPLPGLRVNGERTLRENIADLAGIRVALDAFKRTDQFKRNQTIGGFTPLQRFFLAFAYRQMLHARPERLASQLRSDNHATDRERVNGIVVHIPEFYEAFDVRPGDRMYLPESARVRIW
jgi:putative endopeptidase